MGLAAVASERRDAVFSRRLRPAAMIGLALILLSCSEPAHRESSWEAMGSTAEAIVYTRAEHDADTSIEHIRRKIDEAASMLDPDSETGALGQLNRTASDEFYRVKRVDLFACIKLALDYGKESGGAYDPTVGVLRRLYTTRLAASNPPRPLEIDVALTRVGWEKVTVEPEAPAVRFRAPGLLLDLGTVGQGCAVDWASRAFARSGSLGGLIRIGGVYRAWESPAGQEAWHVRLSDPRSEGRPLLTLTASNRGLAVCGQPEVGEESTGADLARVPVLDPRTGQAVASDLLAVVTTADSSADAAALCQAMFVSGSLEGPDIFSRMLRTEAALLVRADGGTPYLVASASLRGRLELSAELEAEIGGDVRYLLPPDSF
jgi:thiamine biosynthesis lipoprotein